MLDFFKEGTNVKKKYICIIVVILGLLLIDQITKFIISRTNYTINIIEGVLQFTFAKNTGGAFSLAQNNLWGIIITNSIVLGIVIRFMIIQFDKMNRTTKLCGSFILAGGISNLLDRIIRGYVVDFIDITPIFKFPIFNIADIYIVVGWIVFVILTIKYTISKNNFKTNEK